jgi:CHAT domain-containing protein
MLVSNYRRLPDAAADDVYRVVWQTRALVTRLAEDRRQYRLADPAAPRELDELRAVRRQLATLTLAETSWSAAKLIRQRLTALSEQKESLERQLGRRAAPFARQLHLRESDFVAVVKNLPRDVALVDFLRSNVSDNGTFLYDAFVLRPSEEGDGCRMHWVQLGAADPIEQAVASWRYQLAAGRGLKGIDPQPPPVVAAPNRVLRDLVWDKLEPHLSGVTHVIIIPDAALARVPWAALPGREENSVLLDDYALSTVTYGQRLGEILARASSAASDDDRVLLVGAVDYDRAANHDTGASPSLAAISTGRRETWRALAATNEEIRQIGASARNSAGVLILSDEKASEAAVREQLPRSRGVHFATHGFFDQRRQPAIPVEAKSLRGTAWRLGQSQGPVRADGRNPLALSGVVLSGANLGPALDAQGLPLGDDGVLTGEEVVGLDLSRTDLVVLSACETGLGDLAGGEGVFGLQRSFEMAGAATCVASLWQVPDEATQRLMTRFYENLWQKRMGKLAALREAQLWLRREAITQPEIVRGAHTTPEDGPPAVAGRLPPYYWAAFVLSGDWR